MNKFDKLYERTMNSLTEATEEDTIVKRFSKDNKVKPGEIVDKGDMEGWITQYALEKNKDEMWEVDWSDIKRAFKKMNVKLDDSKY